MTDLFTDETLRTLYKGLDLPIIIMIVFLSRTLVRAFNIRKERRALVPLGLGVVTALAVPSPYEFTAWTLWRRVLTYGAGASTAYQLRHLWMPKVIQGQNGTETNGGS